MSNLKYEDAYYFKILLMSGFNDGYDEWLDGYLEAENPLSDIVLDLSSCGSNLNKTISCLHNYCMEHDFDERDVCDKLRLFLKEAYYSNRMSKEEVVSSMYRFAVNHGDPGDFELDLWGDMFYMDDYYSLAKDGIISCERFDFAFHRYLDDGTHVDKELIWNETKQSSTQSFFKRVLQKFRKR